MSGTLVLLSGGLDSTVLLAHSLDGGEGPIHTLSVDYGQRHAREVTAAAGIAAHYGVRHDTVDLTSFGASVIGALTDGGAIPEGRYAEAGMAATVVPNRNAVLLMLAAGIADSRDLACVVIAVHGGDHSVYPDCRPEFVRAASAAATLGTGGGVRIHAPFVCWAKRDIVAHGRRLAAPLELTWSCYVGGAAHCGRCGTCVERAEAFHAAGVPDPTQYDDPTFWRGMTA